MEGVIGSRMALDVERNEEGRGVREVERGKEGSVGWDERRRDLE